MAIDPTDRTAARLLRGDRRARPVIDFARPTKGSLVLGALVVAVAVRVVAVGPLQGKDSVGYLEGAAFRSPLYPLFLESIGLVFGGWRDGAVVAIQLLVTLVAVAALAATLRKTLGLSTAGTLLCAGFFLLPLVGGRVANYLLTESLAYALFLVAFKYLVTGVLAGERRAFALFLAFAALAVLTRPQFVFLFAVAAVVALVPGLAPGPARRRLALLGLLAGTVAVTGLAEAGYRYARDGEFAYVPFTGIQMMASALYVSQPDDHRLFAEPDASFFRRVRTRLGEARLLAADNPRPRGISRYSEHYASHYNTIVWRVLVPEMRGRWPDRAARDDTLLLAADRRLVGMSLRVLAHNLPAYLRLYASNLLSRTGTYYAILLAAALGGAVVVFHRTRDPLAGALLLALFAHGFNHALVAALQSMVFRYTFYTDVVHLPLLILFLLRGLDRRPPAASPAGPSTVSAGDPP
jgi:hypothetical protein